MRFRFCGDLDCPDWVLAEISTLAKISSVKLKLICGQVLKDLQGERIDYEKILKLTSDARFEHATGLCRSYEEKQSPLQDSLRTRSLRLNHLDSVSWRVDQTLSSSELQQVNEPLVHLKFTVRDGDRGVMEPFAMSMSAEKFRVLLAELRQAHAMMKTLS
ncbi:COMM domain-containing protein 4-like isoform X2 [Gopherus flavomarginatus]|uniref:COMM domain-containing protein 4-like isoform X2 n=1 Tax=Gopherus flavomarginatus TaxID=286002 RepID=UPI0021CBCE9C|nr:COMM domain-containing protein 4-like isoform X2 [Gopherus flavomarginatus]